MTKEEIYEKVKEAIDKEPWFSPDWEPWAKCSDEEKEQFRVLINIIAKLCPKSLGAVELKFEKCSPYRGFLCFEPKLGHNPEFLNTLIEMAIGKEEDLEQLKEEIKKGIEEFERGEGISIEEVRKHLKEKRELQVRIDAKFTGIQGKDDIIVQG